MQLLRQRREMKLSIEREELTVVSLRSSLLGYVIAKGEVEGTNQVKAVLLDFVIGELVRRWVGYG